MGRKEKLLADLNAVNRNLQQQEQYRVWLLAALAEKKTTSDGKTQHDKLEAIERSLRSNTRDKQNIEAVLAADYGYKP